jgi:D-3-phosphoglycerate dehydrogenase
VGNGKTDAQSIRGLLIDADAIILRLGRLDADLLDSAPHLKVVARHGAGFDTVDIAHCTKRGIRVTYAPTSNSNAVAEGAIALMFAVSRHIPAMDKAQREGNWDVRKKYVHIEFAGKTLGIVGTGRIGTLVAKKATGLGMRALGFDAYAKNVDPCITLVKTLDELLAASDVISVHVPSTPETKGMCDSAFFSKMKKDAIFINCARGDLVNEDDLYTALHEMRIYGAGLDVFAAEPTKPGDKLFTLDNIVVSPHAASYSREALINMALHAAQGVDDVLSGREPQWPVNKLA